MTIEKLVEFLDKVDELKAKGISEKDISLEMGFITVAEFRTARANAIRTAVDVMKKGEYKKLREAGYPRSIIQGILNIPESTMLCYDRDEGELE